MINPKFTAHRGRTVGSGHMENTIGAIKSAILSDNVQAVEIDVQLTKDDIFVLMNYQTLNNVIYNIDSEKNKVSDYTYAELCKMNLHCNINEIVDFFSNWSSEKNIDKYDMYGQKLYQFYQHLRNEVSTIPTLEEVLNLDFGGKDLFIEIKTNYSKEQRAESLNYVRKLLSLCRKYKGKIIFIGRDVNTLMAIKEENSTYECLPVIGYDDVEKALCGLDGVSVAQNHLEKQVPGTGKRLFEYFAEKNDPIAIWTIDTINNYRIVNDMLKDVENCYPTSNVSDLLNEYDKKVRHK